MGGTEYKVEVDKENDVNGGFVIPNVSGDVVFTSVASQLNFELIIVPEVTTGLTLVLVKDGVSTGYKYDGKVMYEVERYENLTTLPSNSDRMFIGGDILNAENVRAILVEGITFASGTPTETEIAAVLEDVRNAITVDETASVKIEKDFDVNRNGALWFTDAMTAHGSYLKQYELATRMLWYLGSDVNTDFIIDTDDYDATVEEIWANTPNQ